MIGKLYIQKLKSICISLVTIALIANFYSCSNRIESPVANDDQTIQHLPKNEKEINAVITFCSKVNKNYDRPVNADTKFIISENENVYAIIDLINRENFLNKLLMFHLEWIGPGGKDIYRKRVDLLNDDSTYILQSSISIPPDKRQPGNYSLRIYLFRELIAEKNFKLLNKEEANSIANYNLMNKKFNLEIILCKKISKKTDQPIGVDSVFTIKKGARVTVAISFNPDTSIFRGEFEFNLNWIGPDGESFYTKQFGILSDEFPATLKSSISISSAKKTSGKYKVQLFYGDWIIGESKFELVQN